MIKLFVEHHYCLPPPLLSVALGRNDYLLRHVRDRRRHFLSDIITPNMVYTYVFPRHDLQARIHPYLPDWTFEPSVLLSEPQ